MPEASEFLNKWNKFIFFSSKKHNSPPPPTSQFIFDFSHSLSSHTFHLHFLLLSLSTLESTAARTKFYRINFCIYINFACLFVRLYQINVKTTEPNGPKFSKILKMREISGNLFCFCFILQRVVLWMMKILYLHNIIFLSSYSSLFRLHWS